MPDFGICPILPVAQSMQSADVAQSAPNFFRVRQITDINDLYTGDLIEAEVWRNQRHVMPGSDEIINELFYVHTMRTGNKAEAEFGVLIFGIVSILIALHVMWFGPESHY